MLLNTQQLLAIKLLPGVGPQAMLKLGNGAKGIYEGPMKTSEIVECLAECRIMSRNRGSKEKIPVTHDMLNDYLEKAQDILDKSKSEGIGAISYYEDIFPNILRYAMDEDGKRREPPFVLFYRGNLEALKMPCLAMIGTRESTITAEKACLYLARNFAARGFCIVSGLALGCDTFAHKGALEAGGKTIAFLSQGLEAIYPSENAQLAHEIQTNGGLLLSEYYIGQKISRYHLVERDRLQAGISLATIVIQAGEGSGTMHTANATLNSQKPLYVVSYKDQETEQHEKTRGNHLLIKKGAIKLTGASDLDKITQNIMGLSKRFFHATTYEDEADTTR